jgi:hypothetical protein
MSRSSGKLKREFEVALAYYQQTVWRYVHNLGNLPLTGAQLDVALRAWLRLDKAQRAWSDSLDIGRKAEALAVDVQKFRPRRLERDTSITPELLATLVSVRLGTTKPKSLRAAAEDAHKILLVSRDYLDGLPAEKIKPAQMLAAYLNKVSFQEILASCAEPGCFPLLPPVQTKRNKGMLTMRALKAAINRHPTNARRNIRVQIRTLLKKGEIFCSLLEEIRWRRFQAHFKP